MTKDETYWHVFFMDLEFHYFWFSFNSLCSTTGHFVGAIQGYYGGWVDLLGQRLVEVWNGLPMLFMVMILVSMFIPNVYWLFLLCCSLAGPYLWELSVLNF